MLDEVGVPSSEQAKRFESLSPDEAAFAVVRFSALAEQLAVEGLRLGQSKDAFLYSLAQSWDQAEAKVERLAAAFRESRQQGQQADAGQG